MTQLLVLCLGAETRCYTLMRRAGGEDVAGRVRLAFQWDITARGLLALKLQALERVSFRHETK